MCIKPLSMITLLSFMLQTFLTPCFAVSEEMFTQPSGATQTVEEYDETAQDEADSLMAESTSFLMSGNTLTLGEAQDAVIESFNVVWHLTHAYFEGVIIGMADNQTAELRCVLADNSDREIALTIDEDGSFQVERTFDLPLKTARVSVWDGYEGVAQSVLFDYTEEIEALVRDGAVRLTQLTVIPDGFELRAEIEDFRPDVDTASLLVRDSQGNVVDEKALMVTPEGMAEAKVEGLMPGVYFFYISHYSKDSGFLSEFEGGIEISPLP